VIGACTAYYLCRRGIDVIVVEGTEVAAAASGKAGGFLALDWCTGSPLDALARRSFALHAALPNEIADDWGYRRMTAYSGFVVPERDVGRRLPTKLDWLSDGVVIASQLGTTETTAIVHPRAFTAAMMSAAQKYGAELRQGRVSGIVRREDGLAMVGVEVDGVVIEADAVVLAMGPWSLRAAEWIALPPCSDDEVRASSTIPAWTSPPKHFSSTIMTPAARSWRLRYFREPTATPLSPPSPTRPRCHATRRP
jgi:flavin-dependent dehydrogenase